MLNLKVLHVRVCMHVYAVVEELFKYFTQVKVCKYNDQNVHIIVKCIKVTLLKNVPCYPIIYITSLDYYYSYIKVKAGFELFCFTLQLIIIFIIC